MTAGLPVSRLINVQVNLQSNAAQYANVNIPMFFGDSNVIDVGQRYRSYPDLASVATDFGTSAPEYLAAAIYFNPLFSPVPANLFIARWAYVATAGLLIGGAVSAAKQTSLLAVASGGFDVTIDGSAQTPTGIVLNAQTTMNGVATQINGVLVGGTVAWNASTSQFTLTSGSTGTSSTVSFATAPGSGTDIHSLLGFTAAAGARLVAGIAAETALAALEILDDMPVGFYGVFYATPDIVNSGIEAIAAYIETISPNNHIFGVYVDDPNAVVPSATSDIGYILQNTVVSGTQTGYKRTFCQYSSTTPYATADIFGLMAGINFLQADTTINFMYKPAPGVTPETLTTSQAGALDAKNYNYVASYANGTAILENGNVTNGFFIDEIQNADWFANFIQTNIFNLQTQLPKIPQTDAGTHLITTNMANSAQQAVNNGYIAPGTWDYPGFGGLSQGQYLDSGFYIYAASIASQNNVTRQNRIAPPITMAAIQAGAINTVGILINVQR